MKNKTRLTIFILVAVLAGACLVYSSALTPDSFGFYHDDSIYVVTAKSLATDQGYRIISLPDEPAQTKYPPLYPFLLSLIWRAWPQFPENLSALMLLSVLATVGFLAFTWRYLTAHGYASKGQALLVVALVAINWRTLILATGIYSEMFYALLSIAGLYLAETYQNEDQTWKRAMGLGVVIGLAFLTRMSGIALLIAVAANYMLQRKMRRALVPIAVGSLFVIAWIGWSYLNRSKSFGANTAYYTSYFQDLSNIMTELQRQNDSSRLSAFLSIVSRNALLMILSIPAVCIGLRYDSLQNLSASSLALGLTLVVLILLLVIKGFLRDRRSGLRLIHTYIVTYLALHLLWAYGVYDRFLMPLLPLLLLFLTTEIYGLIQLARRAFDSGGEVAGKFAAIVLTSAIILLSTVTLYSYGTGLYRSLFTSKENAANRAAEDAEAIGWINAHTDASDVLVCYRDPLYYLYTGRKAARSSSKDAIKLQDQQTDRGLRATQIFRIIDENNAGYLISTLSDFELQSQADLRRQALKTLLDENPQVFVPVFESKQYGSKVYRIYEDAR